VHQYRAELNPSIARKDSLYQISAALKLFRHMRDIADPITFLFDGYSPNCSTFFAEKR